MASFILKGLVTNDGIDRLRNGNQRRRSIDHIHNNRHVGLDIIMQISHVVCQGANIKMMLFLRKSAGLNSEVSAPKSHLRAKM